MCMYVCVCMCVYVCVCVCVCMLPLLEVVVPCVSSSWWLSEFAVKLNTPVVSSLAVIVTHAGQTNKQTNKQTGFFN